MAEEKGKPSERLIVLHGVMRGRRIIELDEESALPDGYRVTLHLVVEPQEALRLAAGGWSDMTPEEEDDLEETVSRLRGRPMNIPRIERKP